MRVSANGSLHFVIMHRYQRYLAMRKEASVDYPARGGKVWAGLKLQAAWAVGA